MLFSSPLFLFLFLPLTLAAFFLCGRSQVVLLLASLVFYAAGEPIYVLLLIAFIVVNYLFGNLLFERRAARRAIFMAAVAVDLGVLCWFKYADFILANLGAAIGSDLRLPTGAAALPLGISFFTFQGLAYLSDIHRGYIAPAPSLFRFALFKSFFPQLIAGPIVRYQQVAADFAANRGTQVMFANGAMRFAVGLAKKVIIADNLAVIADRAFNLPAGSHSFASAWLGVGCFALQIYFDFSGYSDMAIGLGQLFGIRLPENFNYPYVASSIRDFWRRWHITLSTWFRDYVYIPLGGSRHGTGRTYLNLCLVFALCGLWHGASWVFVVWGLYHGLFLILERMGLRRLLGAAPAPVRHLYALLVVTVGWAIFRSPSLAYALAMIQAMAGLGGAAEAPAAGLVPDQFVLLIIAAGLVGSTPWYRRLFPRAEWTLSALSSKPAHLAHAAGLAVLMFGCFAFVASQTHLAFIYFRF